MKNLIILTAIIIIMAGTALANDPNSMPRPTAQDRITVCVRGNVTTIKVYIPDEDQRTLASDPLFDRLIEPIILRYLKSWVEKLIEDFNSDMNLREADIERKRRDMER